MAATMSHNDALETSLNRGRSELPTGSDFVCSRHERGIERVPDLMF
jgi:hypothetical protein